MLFRSLAVINEVIGIPVDWATLPPLNPVERSPEPNDTHPPTFLEDMDDMYADEAGPAQEDEDAVGEVDTENNAVEETIDAGVPDPAAVLTQDERRDKPKETAPGPLTSTPAEPVVEISPAPIAPEAPAISHLLVILLPSPLPATPMELDPPMEPPTAQTLLTLTEMQETIAT